MRKLQLFYIFYLFYFIEAIYRISSEQFYMVSKVSYFCWLTALQYWEHFPWNFEVVVYIFGEGISKVKNKREYKEITLMFDIILKFFK